MHRRWTSSVSTLNSILSIAINYKNTTEEDVHPDSAHLSKDAPPLVFNPQTVEATTSAQPTPLPVRTLCVLFWLHFGAGVCFFAAFPFIPRMVRDFHIAETDEKVGYYVGVVESLFAVSQFLTVFKWSSLSDRIGRKPVLIICLSGLTMGTVIFGLAESFTGILLARFVAGSFSGSIGIMTAIIGEITDRSNQARAFTLLPLASGLAGTVGPWLGGQFAYPADTYPLFDTPFHRSHPYFLPSFLSALVPFLGILACLFLLPETRTHSPRLNSYAMVPTSPEEEPEPIIPAKIPSARDLMCPQVLILLLTYGLVATCSLSCLALFPLFSFTPVESGGLGLSSTWIGAGLALRGIFTIVVQLGSFSQLQAKVGTIRGLQLSTLSYVITFVVWATLPSLARGQHDVLVIFGVIFLLLSWASANQAWSFTSMMMTNRAPSKATLGTLNGMLETVSAGVKAFSPTMSSNLFALSVDRHWLNGQLWWIAFLFMAMCLFLVTFAIEEDHVALPLSPSSPRFNQPGSTTRSSSRTTRESNFGKQSDLPVTATAVHDDVLIQEQECKKASVA